MLLEWSQYLYLQDRSLLNLRFLVWWLHFLLGMLEIEVLDIGGVIIPVSLLRLIALNHFSLVSQVHIPATRIIRRGLGWKASVQKISFHNCSLGTSLIRLLAYTITRLTFELAGRSSLKRFRIQPEITIIWALRKDWSMLVGTIETIPECNVWGSRWFKSYTIEMMRRQLIIRCLSRIKHHDLIIINNMF